MTNLNLKLYSSYCVSVLIGRHKSKWLVYRYFHQVRVVPRLNMVFILNTKWFFKYRYLNNNYILFPFKLWYSASTKDGYCKWKKSWRICLHESGIAGPSVLASSALCFSRCRRVCKTYFRALTAGTLLASVSCQNLSISQVGWPNH